MKQFQWLKVQKPKLNSFDLSFEKKFTAVFGKLIPVFMQEVLPGDIFKIRSEHLIRTAPMIAPIYQRINVYTHYFFVPYRLIWLAWEQFITGDQDGDDVTPLPVFENDNGSSWEAATTEETLGDYMGLQKSMAIGVEISALPIRAYRKIFNDWYRDETIQDELENPTTSSSLGIASAEAAGYFDLLYRNYEKDYFTTLMPYAQRGSAVTIPLSATAPLDDDYQAFRRLATGEAVVNDTIKTGASGQLLNSAGTWDIRLSGNVNLENAAGTISDLRAAYALQRWYEKNLRGGYRYVEYVLNHFGVRTKDARLQRSEYIGGGRTPVMINSVNQTVPSYEVGEEASLGSFAGQGHSSGQNGYVNHSFTEHGIVLGIMSIMPRQGYMDAVDKFWFKKDRFDFYTPDFAHIGEQAVTMKEIYGNSVNPDLEFGYQPRYEEYRNKYSTTHGLFKTDYDFWHTDRGYFNPPEFNDEFIECNPSTRIWAINWPDEGRFFVDMYVDFKALRPVAKFGNPY